MPQKIDPVPKPATEATRLRQVAAADLAFDTADFDRAAAKRLRDAPTKIENGWGLPVWDLDQYDFCAGEYPDTVNPSLWRQAQLNLHAGLFEVCDGVYQVRGIDLSNLTVVRGDTGWIVIDPLSSAETAAAAMALVTAEFGERPVRAVIYTHSHVDHFAGVRGVIDENDIAERGVEVIAPEGFMEAAVSENVYAGPAMVRRAIYMYGPLIEKGPQGQVDAGLGKGIPLLPSTGLIAPTISIGTTGQVMMVDGVEIVFHYTPDTEAPAEMNFYFPQFRALCMAENCCGTMHNLYTPRGAQVRDGLSWSKYIDEAITLFGEDLEVVFASVLRRRLDDGGELRADEASTRGYYGTISHNVKAVYQRYLGYFDGNPAHLHPLPPESAGENYVELMGGAESVISKAQELFASGEYRFAAEVLNHLIFSDPENARARGLQADTFEQLGYQAESAVWRNFYLQGARELRNGILALGGVRLSNPDVAKAMTLEMLLDLVGIRLDAARLGLRSAVVSFELTDREDSRTLWFQNRAVHHRAGVHTDAEIRVTGPHAAIAALCTGESGVDALADEGQVSIDGDTGLLAELWANMDTFDLGWGVATP